MRDVLLEGRIREVPGVSTCTAGPAAVVVVAGSGVDAAELERRIAGVIDLEGRSLQVVGGVRVSPPRSGPSKRAQLPELGRVALVAAAAAGLVGLLVGPSSDRFVGSVLDPVAPLSPVGSGPSEGRPVRTVSNRTAAPVVVADRLVDTATPALLPVEPVLRRRPVVAGAAIRRVTIGATRVVNVATSTPAVVDSPPIPAPATGAVMDQAPAGTRPSSDRSQGRPVGKVERARSTTGAVFTVSSATASEKRNGNAKANKKANAKANGKSKAKANEPAGKAAKPDSGAKNKHGKAAPNRR